MFHHIAASVMDTFWQYWRRLDKPIFRGHRNPRGSELSYVRTVVAAIDNTAQWFGASTIDRRFLEQIQVVIHNKAITWKGLICIVMRIYTAKTDWRDLFVVTIGDLNEIKKPAIVCFFELWNHVLL